MLDRAGHIEELARRPDAVAVLHHGAFVYANAAFLQLCGMAPDAELTALLFLDLIEPGDRERARLVLAEGLTTPAAADQPNAYQLRLRRPDQTQADCQARAHQMRFDGEDCVLIQLTPSQSAAWPQRLRALPWRLYFSIAFVCLFTILPSALLTRLSINNAPDVYFPDDEPAVVIDRALRERFPNDQVFVLLFEGVALFSEGLLEALDALAGDLERLEFVDRVLSVTRLDHISGSDDGFSVEPLIDVQDFGASRWHTRRDRAVNDRFAQGLLVARDGSALALVVVPKRVDDSLAGLRLEQDILAAVERARLRGHLTAVAGQVAVDVAELRAMLHDNMLFIPATVLIGLALIWVLFRRMVALVVSGLALGVVTNSTVAVYALLGQPFTLISSIIPPLLSALTVAALVHLFNAIQYAAQHGYHGPGRVDRALAEVRKPALFTALTTMAGLASLGTSPIVPIAAFGLISAAGVLLIYFVVIEILPALLKRWDRQPWPKTRIGLHWMDLAVRRCSRVAIRRPLLVTVGIGLGLLLGLPQLFKVKVETDIHEFFQPDHEIRVATDRIDRLLAGTNSLEVVFESPVRDGLADPATLARIKAFQTWAKTLPQVDNALSYVDVIEEMHWAFNGEDPAFRAIPTDRRLVQQYLLVYDGEDLWDFVDRDLRLAHVPLNVNVHSANATTELMQQIRDYLAAAGFDDIGWEIAGLGRLVADMEDLLVTGQVRSLWGALGVVFLLLILAWRSLRDAAICMIPNLSPILLIFVLMGLLDIWLDMATAMIASVAVGIAVDDTIHLYHGFSKRFKASGNAVSALARTYRHVGRAVTTTTLILCAQFMILTASEFVPTTHFGLLTSVGLVTAWAFDVTLFPAILMLVFHRPQRRLSLSRNRATT